MTPPRPGIRRLFRLGFWRRRDAARDLADEMELHIALRAERLERAGMGHAEAVAEARRLFAMTDRTLRSLHRTARDRNRHMRLHDHWNALRQDTRYAARRLLRDPATTGFILCTLALGIGLNVTTFSVVDRVLFRGPQYVVAPERLIRFYSRVEQPPLGLQTDPYLPYSGFGVLRAGMRTLEGIAAYRVDDRLVGSGAASEMRRVSRASSELFGLLGVRPFLGHFYGSLEDDDQVAVLGERFWRQALGGDPDVIGTTLVIDNAPHTIVGVAPAGFTGPQLGRVDVWTPITVQARNSMNVQLVGRLRPRITVDAVLAEIAVLRPRIEATLPSWGQWLRGASYLAAPISYGDSAEESVETVVARWFAAISLIILIITCANVANLLLARLARRRRELGVRVALGAGRARVVRLLAVEGAFLAIGAALLSLGVIVLSEPVIRGALFPNGAWEFRLLDLRVLGAVAGFMLFTGTFISLAPALNGGRPSVRDVLGGGTRVGESRSVIRSGLTVVQAMLSVVLLVGTGLFLRSIQRVQAVDLGFDSDRVLSVELDYPFPAPQGRESVSDWLARSIALERDRHRRLLEVVRGVPGVERATFSVTTPLSSGVRTTIWVPGLDSVPGLPGGGPWVAAVGPDYFATIGTPIREGRTFAPNEREGSEAVVIVNQAMARAIWPGRSAVGACLQVADSKAPCARVVGVAADIHRESLTEQPSMQIYLPAGQEHGFSGSKFLVRPRGEVSQPWPALKRALEAADPEIRSIDVRVLSDALAGEVRPFRLGMTAFGLSAILALLVAALGLYSVMAHAVAWRRHEIGVRLALGARPERVATLVVSHGMRLGTAGIGLGILISLAARPWIEPQLFHTSASDPVVILGVAAVLEVVAFLAGWVPAQRAVAVNPTEALRTE